MYMSEMEGDKSSNYVINCVLSHLKGLTNGFGKFKYATQITRGCLILLLSKNKHSKVTNCITCRSNKAFSRDVRQIMKLAKIRQHHYYTQSVCKLFSTVNNHPILTFEGMNTARCSVIMHFFSLFFILFLSTDECRSLPNLFQTIHCHFLPISACNFQIMFVYLSGGLPLVSCCKWSPAHDLFSPTFACPFLQYIQPSSTVEMLFFPRHQQLSSTSTDLSFCL